MANTTNFGSIPASQTVITSPSFGLAGNTLGASTISGNDIYLQGGNNMTLSVNGSTVIFSAGGGGGAGVSQLNGSQGTLSLVAASSLSASTNGSTISFGLASNITTALQSAGAYLTTAMLSNQGSSAYFSGNTTAGTSSGTYNGTNVTFLMNGMLSGGMSGNSVVLSAPASTIFQQTSQMSNYAGTGTSATNATITLNSNGLAISVAAPGGGGAINVSAGTTSGNLQTIQFSNLNGISFGLNGSTLTAAHNGLTTAMQSDATTTNIRSYYDNGLPYQGTTAFSMGGSSNYVQPFILPYPISASYIRIANSWAFGSTTGATSANQSLTLNNSQSIWVNIYTKGTGVNASSLQFLTSGSVSLVHQVRVEIGAASNNQTISHNITYPQRGGSAQGNFATNYNVNATSYNVSTTHLTSFNGSRWLDIPFGASLQAGDYWMAIAQSTATATTGGVAAMTNVTARNTYVAVSQINANIAAMGTASNNSTNPMRNGLGYWSTNANGSSSSSLGLTGISSVANQPLLPFQIIREA